MKKKLIIFGAGGLGREIKTLVDVLSDWQVTGFCDDRVIEGTLIMGIPVLGNWQYLLAQQHEVNVVVAIGEPLMKRKVIAKINTSSFIKFPVLIHPKATLGDLNTIHIGAGTVITAGCVLTTDISIGEHVLLNLNATLGHDVKIGAYTSIMPGVNLAGSVIIDKCVLIGSGANILNGVQIGSGAAIGSGAVVTKHITAGMVALGVPAREIKRYGA